MWAPLGARLDFDPAALGSGFRQKCHIESVSDSKLLREARMLHYGATSRSARIVVTLLHESLGPTTAGASLFWTPDSPPVRVGRQRCGASPVRALPRVKSQRRRQTLLSIPRLHAAWEIDRQAWRPSTSPILSRGPKRQARYNAAVRHDSWAHPDNPKERPDAQSHAHPCDRIAVRRIGGPHRRRANLARGQ